MAKKNKNKPKGKNGTKAAARDATAPKPSRSGIYAATSVHRSSQQVSQPSPQQCFVNHATRPRPTRNAAALAEMLRTAKQRRAPEPLPPPCGVVTAPSQIASALRANDAVLVAAVRSSTTTLVRAGIRDAARERHERERRRPRAAGSGRRVRHENSYDDVAAPQTGARGLQGGVRDPGARAGGRVP